jgi:tetratricopeptide (TPR) repeat protein
MMVDETMGHGESVLDEPERPLSRKKLWLFRFIAIVVIPLLLLGGLELALRIGGYGHQPGFLVKEGEFYQSNPTFGWRFFPRNISRTPIPMHLSVDKPAGTYRIVVVGGSAAQGYPDPAYSFSRYLEAMLRARYPEHRFEVANAAMTAANSHMMVPAARDCTKLDPDLLVVYMGNNEVVGPYGPGTVFAGASPSLKAIRTGIWIKGTRVGQLLGNTLGSASGKGSGEWRGMEMFLENLIPSDDSRLPDTYSHFRRNLEDICQTGIDSGAAVVLCTVPVNVRHCAPFASVHSEGLSDAELVSWQEAYDWGVAQEESGQYTEAVAAFGEAMGIDDRSAELHFRLGRCYVALDRDDEAYAHFQKAKELDALRFRADATINDTIREVASASDGGVMLADAEQSFATVALVARSPGEELFFDHVHPSYLGNYEMARSVFETVVAELPAEITGGQGVAAPTFEECNDGLALTHPTRLRNAASLWKLTQKPPFTNQLNYSDMRERMLARREALWAQTSGLVEAGEMCDAASGAAPDDATLHLFAADIHSRMRHGGIAAEHLAAARELAPNDPQLYVVEMIMHLDARDVDQAENATATYLALQDHSLVGYITVVNLFGSSGYTDKSEAYARQAVDRMPEEAAALTLLAKVLRNPARAQQGTYRQDLVEAEDLLTQAQALQPEYPNAWLELGEIQLATGRTTEASASLREAIRLSPTLSASYVGMGTVFFRQGKVPQARACFARAVELSPDDISALSTYAELLCMNGETGRSVAMLERAWRISPGTAAIAGKMAWLRATSSDPEVRNGGEAVRLATIACANSQGRLSPMVALAAAYAAEGRFSEAIAVSDQILSAAARSGDTSLIGRVESHRAYYTQGQALHFDRYDRLEGW